MLTLSRLLMLLLVALLLVEPVSDVNLNRSQAVLQVGADGSGTALGPTQVRSLATQLRWSATQARIPTITAADEVLNQGIELTDEEIVSVAPVFSGDAVAVSIELVSVGTSVIQLLNESGGKILRRSGKRIESMVPFSSLDEIESHREVAWVDLLRPPSLSSVNEAVAIHGATDWHSAGLTGTGVKIGILDSGYSGFAALMGTALPSSVVAGCHLSEGGISSSLGTCRTATQHGTGVAEAIHAIAPDAELYISDPIGQITLRESVEWMISQGVDIISHSGDWSWEGYGDGSYFGSLTILESVDLAAAAGILWVQSAGNEADVSWYGTYVDADADGYIEIEPGVELNPVDIGAGESLYLRGRWDDVWGGASRDMDLHVFAPDGTTVVASSSQNPSRQAGGAGDRPTETVFYTAPTAGTYYIGYFLESAPSAPAWMQFRVLLGPAPDIVVAARSVGVPAESSNPLLLAVGAAYHDDLTEVEYYSGRGPTVDGRIKPDIVAVDCAYSETYGLDGFCGTSQSAPHVAGLAALVQGRFPSKTAADLITYLKVNAEPRGTVPNNDWGWGLAQMSPSPADAPTGVTAVAGLSQATVNWTAPAFNGGATITGYTVTSSPGGIESSVDGVTLSAVVTSLIAGTPYTFTVTATNSTGASLASAASNSVTPTGNDPPNTVDDDYGLDEDGVLIVAAGAGVLFNDSDPQGDPMTAAEATGVSNGSLSLSSDGSFTYTPTADFNGSDSFTYTAIDGTDTSAPATVTITVDAVNDAPFFTTGPDQVLTPDAGAQSVVGWATVIGSGPTDEVTQSLSFLVSNDDNTLFTVQPAVSSTGTLTYTPDSTKSGVTTVSVSLQDDGGTSNGGADTSPVDTFTITVRPSITGTVTLQGVAVSTQAYIDIAPVVTLIPVAGGSPLALGSDGTFLLAAVPAGIYTISVNADGFQIADRNGLVIGATNVIMPTIELLSGLVDADGVVDGVDLSLVISTYGTSTSDRTDGAEPVSNLVDLNGDGVVSALDISLVVSNISLTGTQSW